MSYKAIAMIKVLFRDKIDIKTRFIVLRKQEFKEPNKIPYMKA